MNSKIKNVAAFCDMVNSTKDDMLIILGDVGLNYHNSISEMRHKENLEKYLPITLLCIHGNHERRPETIPSYKEAERFGGMVYAEPGLPSLLFAKDGEVYNFGGKRCIVIGGAYSVDKHYRLSKNWGWFADEQPSEEIKARVEKRFDDENWTVDIVLSHTCPFKYIPREMFIAEIDQSSVDNSTEKWLDGIENRLNYNRWYCGHYHTDKSIDKMRFMFTDFLELK